MDQRYDTWQSDGGERRWLSLLVDAMEEAARPEVRALPCEAVILQALREQLARPVSRYACAPSAFRLRH